MSRTIDYFIDSETDLALFEYYFEEEINIQSITLQSITFYNSWWTTDILDGNIYLAVLKDKFRVFSSAFMQEEGHYSLADLCSFFERWLKALKITHVKMYCNKNNYIIIELIEDKEFRLSEIVDDVKLLEIKNEWFGFKQTVFETKGNYYSTKPLNFYRTDLFLRSNLVDRQNTFYNNKYSDILCEFPVYDGDQIKHQRYEPLNCTKRVNQNTNHLKFEITDEKEKVVNFRGMSVKLVFSLEINEEKQAYNRVCDTC